MHRAYRVPADDYPLLFPRTRARIREAATLLWALGQLAHALVQARLVRRTRR